MTIINSLIVLLGRRRIHTIVSRELIKPSSPTPPHRRAYNLSSLDQIVTSTFTPLVTFYQNTGTYPSSHDKMLELKNSLSQTLTKYYPFAGRYAKMAPTYVDCNDEGVDFLQASVNSTLMKYLQNSQHDDLNQCFPYGRVFNSINLQSDDHLLNNSVIPLAVQVNHFECGGVAVAVSLSHKIADGSSLYHFFSDWAKMTRICSKKDTPEILIDPHFITCEHTNINFSGVYIDTPKDCVTRSFMFPGSKINDLKLKAMAMSMECGQPIMNPTRVEALTWLLYKYSVAAATKNNSGPYKPTGISIAVNIRRKMIEPLPENSIGNILSMLDVETRNESEMNPGYIIGELRKKKMEIGGIKDIQTIYGHILNNFSEDYAEGQRNKMKDYYVCTSVCGYPTYGIDFGWGKPVKVTLAGNVGKNSFILMDGPNGDGSIEALVSLGKQDMEIVQADTELLAFC
uniref:deacetylvindoline O-acetyltransferase-like n=1 Tax=Erigeron canadensis TaxID=72917 RepID=UPI001CB8E5E4|nr:deacetylvindoline O-acetyltransferase-like [Erigeron canadensis]